VTHLLDTSAILSHFLDEPGAEEVEKLLGGGPDLAGLAAPSRAELDRRLNEIIPDPEEVSRGHFLFIVNDLRKLLFVRVMTPRQELPPLLLYFHPQKKYNETNQRPLAPGSV